MTADAAQDQDIDHDADQTLEDPSARPEHDQATGQADTGDDDQLDNDPLLLAQQDAEEQSAEPPAKPDAGSVDAPKKQEQEAEREQQAADGDDEPADEATPTPKASEADDLQALQEKLPPSDWESLSHKGRSQYLALQRATRQQQERIQSVERDASKFREDYEAVERFVRDQGLSNEDYVRGMPLIAALKRGDQRAIPVLEQQLQHLRQAHGLPETPAAPALAEHAELKALLEEAEDFGIDTSKVRQLLGGKGQAAAGQPQAQPVPQPQPTSQSAPAAPSEAEAGEFQEIYETLTDLGVSEDQFEAHLQRILQTDPSIQQAPVGKRLGAVVRIHNKLVSQQPAPATRRPAAPTLSSVGSRRPPRAPVRGSDTTVDPLAIAKG